MNVFCKSTFCSFILFFLVSCDRDNNVQNSEIPASYANSTVCELEDFNDSILLLNTIKTRGFGDWFLKGAALASADVFGAAQGFKVSVKIAAYITACTGGTAGAGTATAVLVASGICGIGSSYAAYKGVFTNKSKYTCTIMVPASQIYNNKYFNDQIKAWYIRDNLSTKSLLSDEELNFYGELHNKVLQDLINEDLIMSTTRGDNELIHHEEEIEEVFSIPVFSKEDVDGIYSSTMLRVEPYIDSFDYNAVVASGEKDITFKNVDDVLTLYFDALKNYVTDEDKLNFINNKYIEVVKQSSDLSIDDKNSLLIGLFLSKYSFNLWTKNEYLQN